MEDIQNTLDGSNFLSEEFWDLDALAEHKKEEYAQMTPFPSIVLDNLFSPSYLDKILNEFPDLSAQKGVDAFNNEKEKKLATKEGDSLQGPYTKLFLSYLNSYSFISFLQKLTGIQEALLPDPYFEGGGLHEIKRGGLLAIHSDFNKHIKTNLDRRVNILIYLNKEWEESYGGHLELWDTEMKTCGKKILPVFNRMVVFTSTDFSFHGHPDPLTCPEDRSRRSLALYYYSNGRPTEEVSGAVRSTFFRERPDQDQFLTTKDHLKNITLDWAPPILLRGIRNFRKKR